MGPAGWHLDAGRPILQRHAARRAPPGDPSHSLSLFVAWSQVRIPAAEDIRALLLFSRSLDFLYRAGVQLGRLLEPLPGGPTWPRKSPGLRFQRRRLMARTAPATPLPAKAPCRPALAMAPIYYPNFREAGNSLPLFFGALAMAPSRGVARPSVEMPSAKEGSVGRGATQRRSVRTAGQWLVDEGRHGARLNIHPNGGAAVGPLCMLCSESPSPSPTHDSTR